MMQTFSVKEETIVVRGSKVRLLRAGKGEPILWLHGANGGGWNPFLEELSSYYEVLAPDHPGFGASELGDWCSSIEDMAFHYRDLLDVLGYERVYICGQSVGGWIALQFALTQSHRVKKLVVCDSAGSYIPGKDGPNPFLLSMPQMMDAIFHDKSKQPVMPQSDEAELRVLRNRSMFARLAWERGYDPKLLHRLQGLGLPALIVWGRQDKLIPLENGEILQRAIPGSRLTVIEDCGHLPYAEQPAQLKERIVDFLR